MGTSPVLETVVAVLHTNALCSFLKVLNPPIWDRWLLFAGHLAGSYNLSCTCSVAPAVSSNAVVKW